MLGLGSTFRLLVANVEMAWEQQLKDQLSDAVDCSCQLMCMDLRRGCPTAADIKNKTT